MVHGQDHRAVLGGRGEFGLQPGNLGVVKLPALRHVGVQANERDERSCERPVDIGLGHGRAPGACALAGHLGAGRAEVGQEAVE